MNRNTILSSKTSEHFPSDIKDAQKASERCPGAIELFPPKINTYMLKKFSYLNDKKILIWGYGREGKSTEDFLKRNEFTKDIEIFEGKESEIDFEKYDYVFKSPGIALEKMRDNITSQTEVFLEAFRDQVIGVTGTKGKSTTSAMFNFVLQKCQRDVILAGNMGLPALDYAEEINKDTIIVLELSCHQLATAHVSPHVAVFLNLYEEHLDYYKTFENYFKAKQNIARFQNENDYFYVGENVPEFEVKSKKKIIKWDDRIKEDLGARGEHNKYNATFVKDALEDVEEIIPSATVDLLKLFNGLEHRLEYLGNVDGIDYYNDSISTIPRATIMAADSVKNCKTLLIGGMDRGISYDELIEFAKKNSQYNYVFMYATGKRIYKELKDNKNCYYEKDLQSALNTAKKITSEGEAIILSPAAPSYGDFKDFEDRGNTFKKYLGLYPIEYI